MAAPASEGRRWWRRWPRAADDLDDDDQPRAMEEEGEVVLVPGPGCHSHSETDTDEYYNRHSPSEYVDDEADSGRRGATSVVIPANNGGHASTSSSVAPRGSGGTGMRGRSGGRAVSLSAEPDHQSVDAMAAAAPKAVLKPVPLAFAPPSNLPASPVPTASAARTTNHSGQSSSAQSVHNEDAMETVVALAGASIPRAEAAAVHQQPLAPPRPAAGRQNPDGYTCPKCGMWFATHQGLGGHSVGHKHREREQLLAAGAGGGRDEDAKRRRERVHVCGECGAEYATGVQLGGHMRKHWAGAPIVPKKKPRAAAVVLLDQPLPPPPAADVTLALAVKADDTSPAAAGPPAVEPEPAVGPAGARSPLMGRLRLFGVDIGPPVQTPEAQQGSPATGSSGSTGGQQ